MISQLHKFAAGIAVAFCLTAPLALANETTMANKTVVVGHFGNPTPMQAFAARNEFAKATGWTIEWRQFESGAEVIEAMSKGDIAIAELGSAPLAVAANQGIDLQLFMIAQIIGEAESLIVRNNIGINTIAALEGRRIAVPFGSTAHFSLMGVLYKAGLTAQDVELINLSPNQITEAWEQKAIDGAFIWQPVQSRLLKTGRLLVSADRTAEWGYPTFDGWVVNRKFAADNADALTSFVKVMDEANAAYLKDPSAWLANKETVRTIAERTGATPGQIPEILNGYTFLPISTQVKASWFGNSIARMITYTAGFLTVVGKTDGVAEDYSEFINTGPTRAAMK